jgi:hypothetical protein
LRWIHESTSTLTTLTIFNHALGQTAPYLAFMAKQSEVIHAFRTQIEGSLSSGSKLYSKLLTVATADLEAGGIVAELTADWEGTPLADALPLRLLGALHDRVLAGLADELAAAYALAAAGTLPENVGALMLEALSTHRDFVRGRLDEQLQTHEVRRCAALLPGFLEVSQRTGLPLRLLEFGASGGLNLGWDRHRYELGPHRFGPETAPVVLKADWEGPPPALSAPLAIASRAGCDRTPIDIGDPVQRRKLVSFIWPDQPERQARLQAAIASRPDPPPQIEALRVLPWLQRELAEPKPGVATVIYHSIVWQYLDTDERTAVEECIYEAGERATPEAPLAWWRMEPLDIHRARLDLTLWPHRVSAQFGTCHYHGASVAWSPPEG